MSGRGGFCFVFPSLPSVSLERKRYVFSVLPVVGCCCFCFFPFSFCRGIRGLGFESRNLEVYEVAGCVSFGMQFSSLGLVFSGTPGGGGQGGFMLCPFGRRKLLLLSCVVWFVRFASDSYEFRRVSSLLGSLGLEDGKCKSCDFFHSLLSSFERFFFPRFYGLLLLWNDIALELLFACGSCSPLLAKIGAWV